jgi:hypothetical protein
LELTGGSVIKGDLVSWNGQQAVVKAEFGSLTFKREQLSHATLQTCRNSIYCPAILKSSSRESSYPHRQSHLC